MSTNNTPTAVSVTALTTTSSLTSSRLAHRPFVLMILDGWGYSEELSGNAIRAAQVPVFNRLWQSCPHALLAASGLDVGLPRGQMGNSEVGHLHIGAGRRVLQDLTKVDLAIETGEFFKNPVLLETVKQTMAVGGALHVFGLLSPGGVHSRNTHLEAMVELAVKQGLRKIYVHAFLDGRDTPPRSAASPIQSMEKQLQSLGCGKIATIVGRYYAMDRDKRWERVKVAYDMLTAGKASFVATTALAGLEDAYSRGESDEFVRPTIIAANGDGESPVTIKDGDSIVFMNFRTDRGRELSYAFTDPNFDGFDREFLPRLTAYVTLTEYAADLAAKVVYPQPNLTNVLGEVVAKNNLTQLRIAETEKYAHVTFFLNAGHEQPFAGEDRILVPSPKVATYDLQPEMSALEVTSHLLDALRSQKYDVIVCNYANPDMLGHTGNFVATVKALTTVDTCLGEVVAQVQKLGGEMLIIADHGNAEQMLDEATGQVHTAHTTNPVPFIYVSSRAASITKNFGTLIDVAPTMLYLMGIEVPQEMTGDKLLVLK